EPQKNVNIKFSGEVEGSKLQREYKYNLPEKNTEHPFLRRNWAKRRVDWLVDKIRMEGEDENLISEIINLSKQFKFVTPYTSFLAAPRSLLRPRVIKPGDPILRVKTDPAIIDVIAVFPFGLIKHMTYLENQDIWETRFLAPKWMNDGDYTCKLFLKDKNGNQYVENKEFVIDSRPPEIKLVLEDKLKTGSLVKVKAYADKDTRTLKVSLPYSDIVDLRYDHKEKASVGYLRVPQNIMPGEYKLKVWGEDFAHNTTVNEVTVQIVGS
ncbi:VWA domain-containing protein, partial [bacterium]|nr:VWA domain-containing protein [bacterium]